MKINVPIDLHYALDAVSSKRKKQTVNYGAYYKNPASITTQLTKLLDEKQ